MNIPANRPACSASESLAADVVLSELNDTGLDAVVQAVPRAMTSPSWVALIAAGLRLIGAALVAAGTVSGAIFVAIIAALLSLPGTAFGRSRMLGFPGLASATRNVVAKVTPDTPTNQPALVVVATLDTHPTARNRIAAFSAFAIVPALVLVAAAFLGYKVLAFVVAVEAAITIGALAWLETRRVDGSKAPLQTLVETATLLSAVSPLRPVWVVAVGAGTSFGGGLSQFINSNPGAKSNSWVISIVDTGGEALVAAGHRGFLPPHTTHPAAIRALSGAALEVGHPVDTEQAVGRDPVAQFALSRGLPAITLTCSVETTGQAAAIIDSLARTLL